MTTYAIERRSAGTVGAAIAPEVLRVIARFKSLDGKKRSGAPHPTGRPIHGGSREAGTFEDSFFRAPAKGEPDLQLRALKAAVDQGKKLAREARKSGEALKGRDTLLAKLTDLSARVFEVFVTLSRVCKGEVYPSYEQIAERAGRSRASVARAITLLDQLGFLTRARRFKRIDGDGPGPRYEQTSNAYRVNLPAFAKAFLPARRKPAPVPTDIDWREEVRVSEVASMLASLPTREFNALASDRGLREVMQARASLELREALASYERSMGDSLAWVSK